MQHRAEGRLPRTRTYPQGPPDFRWYFTVPSVFKPQGDVLELCKRLKVKEKVVELRGLEPLTSRVRF